MGPTNNHTKGDPGSKCRDCYTSPSSKTPKGTPEVSDMGPRRARSLAGHYLWYKRRSHLFCIKLASGKAAATTPTRGIHTTSFSNRYFIIPITPVGAGGNAHKRILTFIAIWMFKVFVGNETADIEKTDHKLDAFTTQAKGKENHPEPE